MAGANAGCLSTGSTGVSSFNARMGGLRGAKSAGDGAKRAPAGKPYVSPLIDIVSSRLFKNDEMSATRAAWRIPGNEAYIQ